MINQTLILIGIVVLVLLVLAFSRRGAKKSSDTRTYRIDLDDLDISDEPPQRYVVPDGKDRDYFRSGHRHNGRIPKLLLAPYRLYGPAFIVFGLVTTAVASLLGR